MFADLAFLLYLGHLISDYPLQSDHQAVHKAAPGLVGWRANVAHTATHVVVCGLLLALGAAVLGWRLPLLSATAALLWIGGTHAVIDRRWPVAAWMRLARQKDWAAAGGAAHVDQTAHIAALVVAALCLSA
ncbi:MULTISPECIES: DUF3307 domain-containing protein [unclassified Streptomyces]|uniref:DUF3307 domain-containing protein n=1 Tax=unclassified Streptomyces TaxID=2593676 RepID=UPI000DAC0BB7|nr:MULTISPECIES: DUF3307 domain-containing protein [unclassified Streptomyces]PZT72255.1 DUF3307 domain-containing protein [Streptomyces sp. AC1-42T]PZT81423.1 DUF3307 domain-containing protein [Streptomyces sp. AC1-42W]